MSAPDLAAGTAVDVTIEGATIGHPAGPGWVNLFIDGTAVRVPVGRDRVTVTRAAPAPPVQWPPKPGDVWLDSQGNPWWARQVPSGLHMTPSTGGRAMPECQWLDVCGPPILAWRVGYEMPTGPQPVLTEQQHADLLDRLRAHGEPATADEPGGWMRPGERGSVYVKTFDVVTEKTFDVVTDEDATEACADEPAPLPEVDMVAPSEIEDGDAIRIPGVSVDVVVDDHESTYAGTTSFFYERDGREHEHIVHHGGAVARVRTRAQQGRESR